MDNLRKSLVFKIIILLIGIVFIIISIKNLPWILTLTTSPEKFRNYIISLGNLGIGAFIVFQILQIIIAPIPGEVVQIAGGYIYGTILGSLYTIIGLMLGALLAFYFTRIIGSSFIEKLLAKKNFNWLNKIVNSNKLSIVMLIMFLVPGLPKDFLIYFAALTHIKSSKFFLILLAGRFPALLASVYIGSSVHQKNYVSTIIVTSIGLICVILGFLCKNKLIDKFSKASEH